ncbi:hypothetical protein LZS94_18240 [Aliivibrio fischeri]|uniref:HEPN domain-containing protein n=1 Tax=Aliivibrio fischeri TaxID=668 RepID=UPI001F3F23F9|nr:HEPN domain-containing protein [Aliivibrio fischeri]MCE7579459.1 hypothetical protein [Aliivibrio fischeri]MCE7591748.1 hypothetical protein [Aliivibrio fischeri]
MSARSDFISRIKYLNVALNSPDAINVGLGNSEHNGAANLIRKGLGIVAFNILEDFIKAKSSEALDSIAASGIAYSNLPPKLQEATTLGALKALAFRAQIEKRDGGDWMGMIHSETEHIHSTSLQPFSLSKYSFASEKPNVGSQDISDLLKAFEISKGWDRLKEVSDNILGGVPNLSDAYKNAADRRHNAAHSTDFEYEHSWLSNIEGELISIAASIDILLTALCREVDKNIVLKLNQHNLTNALKYRFLVFESNVYKEKLNINSNSIKNWSTLEDAVNYLQPKLVTREEFLIVHNASGRVVNWYT